MHWIVPDDEMPAMILRSFPQFSMTEWKDALITVNHMGFK